MKKRENKRRRTEVRKERRKRGSVGREKRPGPKKYTNSSKLFRPLLNQPFSTSQVKRVLCIAVASVLKIT